jgi:chemotaxis protein methyltransferase CheR
VPTTRKEKDRNQSPSALAGLFKLTDREFDQFRLLVHSQTGISLGPHKREMLQARLSRRLRALGLPSFTDYYRYLCEHDSSGEELSRFVTAVTTHVTHFFREKHHFDFLANVWLPAQRARIGLKEKGSIRIWSAGCSTGEEPYSIAMTLRYGLGSAVHNWDIRILGSDVDADALARAADGIYPADSYGSTPQPLLSRYFHRDSTLKEGHLRVRLEIQSLVTLRQINLMEDRWPIRSALDAIFCRNVLIYFDRPTQQQLLKRLILLLKEDGYLFLGHSEGLQGQVNGMKYCQNTIYQRCGRSQP